MQYRIENSTIMITIDKSLHKRTLAALFERFMITPKTQQRLFADHAVRINDAAAESQDALLQSGDTVCLVQKEEDVDWPASDTLAEVVWRNAFLIAVHKPADRIIHSERYGTDCLNADVAAWLLQQNIHTPVRPLHRLDKDTEGLVLYSLVPLFQPWFDNALKEHRIRRCYLALCKGNCTEGKKMTIRKPIGKDRHVNGKYRISSTGKDACTQAECLYSYNGFSLMRCILETGRTHQIRVHLSDAGYPIVNDPLYGISTHAYEGMGLWAYEVTVRDPLSGKKHTVKDRHEPSWRKQFPVSDSKKKV